MKLINIVGHVLGGCALIGLYYVIRGVWLLFHSISPMMGM